MTHLLSWSTHYVEIIDMYSECEGRLLDAFAKSVATVCLSNGSRTGCGVWLMGLRAVLQCVVSATDKRRAPRFVHGGSQWRVSFLGASRVYQ